MQEKADAVAMFLAENGWLDWLGLRHYPDSSFAGKISGLSDRFLNTENWKEGVCSPTLQFSSESTTSGTVIQCANGFCQPVLTMAAERITKNESQYIYAISYYLGGVVYPQGTNEKKETVSYMVTLREGSESVDLFQNFREWPANSAPHEFSFAFNSTAPYSEVCINFEYVFPPNEIAAKKEYCRSIVDADTGDSAWDTGRPTRPDEYITNSSSSGNSSSTEFEINTEL